MILELILEMPYHLSQESATTLLKAKFLTNVGKMHSTAPIMIQIDSSKPPPRINPYPMSNETLQGIELIIEDYKVQGLIILVLVPITLPFYRWE